MRRRVLAVRVLRTLGIGRIWCSRSRTGAVGAVVEG